MEANIIAHAWLTPANIGEVPFHRSRVGHRDIAHLIAGAEEGQHGHILRQRIAREPSK
jgi:hypothetical protein